MMESPNIVHGRLLEAVHISGYSFERACSELEYLLDEERWKQLGAGFSDINEFLATIDFSGFRVAVEQRKRIAEKLKKIEASQRATAKMLGVDQKTISNDLIEENSSRHKPQSQATPEHVEENSSKAWFQDPKIDPAKLAKNKERQGKKAAERDKREQEWANRILAGPKGKYGIIVEDFEWHMTTWSKEGMDRHASNTYLTSDARTAAEIVKATEERFICAAEDCLVLSWTTIPHLAIALDVMRLRGIEYRSNHVWHKQGHLGLGRWVREVHEQLLIGARGKVVAPEEGKQLDSLIGAPKPDNRHSSKPEYFLDWLNKTYPNVPKIELNRVGPPYPGFDAWGAEAS